MTMGLFAIYKYEFTKNGSKDLFAKDTGESVFEQAQEYLGRELSGAKLNLYKVRRDGEPVIYKNDIRRTANGITVMTVCNVKKFTYVKDYKELKEESNPYCYVIIDNRKDISQIAIEQTSSFDNNTDKVRDILQESLQAKFSEMGLNIEIKAKMRTMRFWELVDERCNKHKDTIDKVVFNFNNPDQSGPIDTEKSMKDKLRMLSSLAKSIGAAKGSLSFESGDNGNIMLDRTQEDFANMVSLCCNNGYDISVRFRKMGIFRYGDNVRALYNMDGNILPDFINMQMVIGENPGQDKFALTQWLDDVRDMTKGFDYVKKTQPRRKGKHKRQVW